ncbi:MAG: hypothetical protein ABH891_07060 [Candidatus Omnitrophota bacterium]
MTKNCSTSAELYSDLLPIRKSFAGEFLFFLMVSAFSFFFVVLQFGLNFEYEPASLIAMANNVAFKPAQYRVLIPWIARSIYDIRGQAHYSLHDIYWGIEFVAVFFLFYAFRFYLSLFINNKRENSLLSLSLILILPFNFLLPRFLPFYYPYDIPAILCFTLGLSALHENRKLWFYLIFLVATLNKESSCFLAMVFYSPGGGKKNIKRC